MHTRSMRNTTTHYPKSQQRNKQPKNMFYIKHDKLLDIELYVLEVWHIDIAKALQYISQVLDQHKTS